jgi:hypothetical protein
MKMCKKVKAFYRKHLKYPNEDNFDPEFQKLLQIMYFLGWFQPKLTKKRILYGVFTFFFLILTHLIGIMWNFVAAYTESSIIVFVNLAIGPFDIILVSQVFLFAFKSKKVIGHIQDLHFMHDCNDKNSTKLLNFSRIRKVYKFSMIVLASLLSFLGLKLSISDDLAIGPFYYFLMLINILHGYSLSFVIMSHDLLTIFCLMRLEEKLNLITFHLRISLDIEFCQAEVRNIKTCSCHQSRITE